MASGGFFRGTNVDQDSRFYNQNKKLLAKLSFPPCFDQKINLSKVKREVINQWITERVTQLLGFEDDIVISMIINLLEPKVDEKLDPKQMQLTITGFLEKDTPAFMKELWELLLSAQAHPTGIPAAILEKKKLEMAKMAQEKHQLRQVLDNKKDAAVRAEEPPHVDESSREERGVGRAGRGGFNPQKYGLIDPREQRDGKGGRGGDTRGRQRDGGGGERDRSAPRPRGGRRSPSPRPRRRGRSPSPSRSRSLSRPPRRSSPPPRRGGGGGGRRSPPRARSRSRSGSRGRSSRRARRSPSSSSSEKGRRRTRPQADRRRHRSPSRSRSSSPDQFGRRQRRRSKSASRSRRPAERRRSKSPSASTSE